MAGRQKTPGDRSGGRFFGYQWRDWDKRFGELERITNFVLRIVAVLAVLGLLFIPRSWRSTAVLVGVLLALLGIAPVSTKLRKSR